jgi:hypothetical protein
VIRRAPLPETFVLAFAIVKQLRTSMSFFFPQNSGESAIRTSHERSLRWRALREVPDGACPGANSMIDLVAKNPTQEC